jgi:hypothetical protein
MSDTISRALREFADELVGDPGRAISDVILSRIANAEDDDVSDAVAELTGAEVKEDRRRVRKLRLAREAVPQADAGDFGGRPMSDALTPDLSAVKGFSF